MTPRPTFTLRELRRMAWACKLGSEWHEIYATKTASAKAARDAASFARLRLKVKKLIAEK